MSSKRERLIPKKPVGFDCVTEAQWQEAMAFNEGYKAYLDAGKTERDCVEETIKQAEAQGFKAFVPGMAVKTGDKLYVTRMNKSMILVVIGQKPVDAGLRIMAAHIDAPRLDLKPNPLYEELGLAMLKTHYYGGVKKYQWMATPLALHGTVYKKDGSRVDISIGDKADDPVLVITDLLPHFAQDQMKKPVSEAFPAENLNAIIGNRPDSDEGEDRVRLAVLELLEQSYGIYEEDFASAELSLVPAGNARDVGLDRSLVGAYGQDDRSCSYAGLKALFDLKNPTYTAVCLLADKEEIGSEGVTGMKSGFFDGFIHELCLAQGGDLLRCFAASFCLSGDVCAAMDPNFLEAAEKRNAARLNYGVGICKYTGRGGKAGASDASAETISRLRTLLDDAGVLWQIVELGKTDLGGGGTVAVYLAQRNIEVVDAGVPVLSMHAPFELTSKLDVYMTYLATLAVYGDK